jgi:hypothetical protein
MTPFFITALFLSSTVLLAKEESILIVRHNPSTKIIAEAVASQCDNKMRPFGETPKFNFKCVVINKPNEKIKFFTLFDDEKEVVTIKGTIEDKRPLKNSVTVGFRSNQLEINF